MAMIQVRKYVHSLRTDSLASGLRLPSPGFLGSFAPVRMVQRYTPVVGTSTANGFSAILNPWLAAFSSFQFQYENAGVISTSSDLGALMTNSATTATVFPNGTAFTNLVLNGSTGTSSTQPARANIRVLGAKFAITYTGANQTKGGTVYAVHNPDQVSMVTRNNGSSAAFSSGPTLAQLASLNQGVSVHRMGDSFEYVWRPTDLEFKSVNSFVPLTQTAIATLSADPEALGKYIPDSTNQGTAVDAGWCTGFVVVPASATAGAAAPYIVTVEVEAELTFNYTDGTSNYISVFPTTQQSYSHPTAHAVAANALAHTHQIRRTHTAHTSAINLAEESYNYVKSGVSDAVKEAGVEALGNALKSIM